MNIIFCVFVKYVILNLFHFPCWLSAAAVSAAGASMLYMPFIAIIIIIIIRACTKK